MVVVNADDFEPPRTGRRHVAQVFAGYCKQVVAFLPVHCGLRRFHVVGSTSLDLNETQDVVVPSNQVDFAAPVGRSEITRDHDVPVSSKVEIGVFVTTPPGAQMLCSMVRRKRAARDPVEDANRDVSKTAGEQ